MNEKINLLRVAPEPRLKEIPDDEAMDLAAKSFHAARRAQMGLLAGHLNEYLFDPCSVNYRRLKSLRSMARTQVEVAQRVEMLINESIETFESTRPTR